MSIIKRYIAKEFITYFLVCALSLLIIAIVFSTLAELPSLEKENGVALFIGAILSGIPLLVEVIVPISVLLATVLAFISLSKSSEIIAMMAAGVSLFHLVLPVLWSGVVIAVLLYFNQSYLAPYWGADERAGLVNVSKYQDVWRFHHDEIYHFAAPDKKTKSVLTSRSFKFDKDRQIRETNLYHDLVQTGTAWEIENQRQITIKPGAIEQSITEKLVIPNDQMPVVFTEDVINPKYTSFLNLINEIRIKMRGAVNYRADLFAVYQKIAGTVSIFVMILLAIPFSIYSGRSANVRTGIVVSVVLGFVFWLVDQILLSFNSAGLMPMVVSAFGANFLFLTLALILIRQKRT